MGGQGQGVEAVATRGRVRLSPNAIVDACIELADREGIKGVTLSRLGAELGVDPTAFYRHFRSKDELLRAVADRLLGEVAEGSRSTGDWRSDLRTIALAVRDVYLAHPSLAHLLATAPAPLPSNTRLAEITFAALRSAGLDDRSVALGEEVIENYVAGASSLDAEVGTDVNTAWRAAFAMLPPERFPNAVSVAPYLYRNDEASFAFGLDLILDALAALGARSA
jgi:AcrR family transcriptional regulator